MGPPRGLSKSLDVLVESPLGKVPFGYGAELGVRESRNSSDKGGQAFSTLQGLD